MPMPSYLRAANEHTLIIVQLESVRAVEQAEAIARVPGVDVLMLGPGDLSVQAGIPYQFEHPIITGALRRIAEAARAAGKAWGTVTGTPEHTRMLMDLGATFLCHGADIVMVKQGLEQIQARYAPLGFTFDNRVAAEAAELARAYPDSPAAGDATLL
jgi:4-hydroxy-2-oxoheptanedioate aldolase